MKKHILLFALIVLLPFCLCLSCEQGLLSSDWIAVGSSNGPAFQNGWGNYGGVYQSCSYTLDNQGLLHIVGLLSDSTPDAGGAIAFTLPEGYRPTTLQRAIISFMPASLAAPLSGTLSIGPSGNVTLYPPISSHQDLADIGHVIIRLE